MCVHAFVCVRRTMSFYNVDVKREAKVSYMFTPTASRTFSAWHEVFFRVIFRLFQNYVFFFANVFNNPFELQF